MAPLVTAIREPQRGGSQAFVSDLARGLAGRGHEVHVYAASGSAIPGVEVIDSDSAQVLVAGTINQTVLNRAGKRVSAGEPSPFRLRVSLDKIDGQWLVDDYQPVTTS